LPVGRKRRRLIDRRPLIVIPQIPNRIYRKDKYTRIDAIPASKSNFRSVGRNRGESRDGIEVRDLALILAVGVHYPDLLVAGPVGREIDMCAEQRLAAEHGN